MDGRLNCRLQSTERIEEEKLMKQVGNSISRFISLLHRLKNECGDSPERLKVFYDQSASVKDAADQLFQFVGWGSFERSVFHSSGKLLSGAPTRFEQDWNDFHNSWRGPLFDAVLGIDLDDLSLQLSPTADEAKPADQTKSELLDVVAPNPDEDCNFDPSLMDGAKAFELAFRAAEGRADDVGGQWEDDLARASNIGLEAYNYLTGTIGFSPEEVFRRWRSLPVFFIPGHVTAKHSEAEKGGLYELLDNAIRAYVFGATLASVAMCRATLELVLKRNYGLDYRYKNDKGHLRDRGLGELIILAEKQYEYIQAGKIRPLVEWANGVLHSTSFDRRFDRKDERALIDFFKTIKFIINRAPNSQASVPEEKPR